MEKFYWSDDEKQNKNVRMWVFIVCVCLGVIVTFIFVAKFLYNHYCKKSKATHSCPSGPVTVIVPSTFANGGPTGGLQDLQSYISFLPETSSTDSQPYVMVGDLSNESNDIAEASASCRDFMSADDDDVLGKLESTDKLLDPPPSYEDLFPLNRRGLDTIDEE